MKRITLILCLLLPGIISTAQNNYDASLIPKDLLLYASAVVRNEEVTTEVKDLDNVIHRVKRAITVLNKNGDDIAHIVVRYDKNIVIKYIKGSSYNEFGKLIGKFGERDFEDESAISNSSLFEDDRVKHYIPAITQYPYTIEYEYELKYKQTLYFEDWTPNPTTGLAVEKSSYVFICNPDFNIRYKELNFPVKVVTGNNKYGLKTYSWEINNMKAIKDEPLSPEWNLYLTRVIVAPEKFAYGNITGSFNNWKEMGKWEYDKLLSDRTDVPSQTAEYIKELTANIADPKLKAKKIYEYMQQKTHYISIQVGIGGFQPFLASDVDKLNYGDCKALVNYTRSLLKVVNIDSYYCLVYGNHKEKISMLRDFASMQGNHVILCIPFKNDTTWLECTSQTKPFGFLSDFTDDRIVLACTPDGGKLMHTPKYTTEENLEKRKASFIINDAGELTGDMETVFKGTDYDDREWIIDDSPAERVRDIKRIYPINNLEIDKLVLKQDKSQRPVTTEDIKLSARDYGSVSDGKFSFTLNSVKRRIGLYQTRNRVKPVNINRGHTEEDEITYTLPKGYHLVSDPLKVSIDKPFGNFTAVMTLSGDQLVYKRKLQIRDGTYSKDTYQDLVDFYQTVVDADGYNVALVKN